MGDIAYCDLSQVKTEIKTELTTDDAVLIQYMQDAAQLIDSHCSQEFMPRIDVRYYRNDLYTIANSELELDYPLLSFSSASNDGTALSGITPLSITADKPYTYLYATSWGSGGANPQPIAITGIWGYREHYVDAWKANTTLGASLDASSTSVTVASSAGLSAGNLIRVGTEYMAIESVFSATAITVERGARGSIAASHSDTTTVDKWQVQKEINRAAYRLAAYMHNRRGDFVSKQFPDPTFAVSFDPIPPDVAHALQPFVRYTYRAV